MENNFFKGAVTMAALYGAYELSKSAFSTGARNYIRDRAGGVSELSENGERPLEASHLIHDKGAWFYNNPFNGILCTDIEHLAYHQLFRHQPGLIGLNKKQNEWAIRQLNTRIIDFNKINNVPAYQQELMHSVERWKVLLRQLKPQEFFEERINLAEV